MVGMGFWFQVSAALSGGSAPSSAPCSPQGATEDGAFAFEVSDAT